MPTQLAFTTQPDPGSRYGAGLAIPFSVSVEDASGQVVTSDNSTAVTLSIAAGPNGRTLSCTNSGGAGPVTVVSGVASFTCSLDKAGNYALSAADTTGGAGHPYLAATSNTFHVNGAAVTQLVFTTQPVSVSPLAVMPAVQVAVEDSYGNVDTSDDSTTITVTLGGGGPGILAGTLTQTVSSGIATFGDLRIAGVGTDYTLTATSSPPSGTATSDPFDVS